jgi:hypothetical protein
MPADVHHARSSIILGPGEVQQFHQIIALIFCSVQLILGYGDGYKDFQRKFRPTNKTSSISTLNY